MDAKHNPITITCPSDMSFSAILFRAFPADAFYRVAHLWNYQ